jgi:nitroreductase
MEVIDAIHRRRAVRDYTAEPVSTAMLQQIIMAASWAPSAMNEQPWRFTVVTDAAAMARISDQAKQFMLAGMANMPQPQHFHDLFNDPDFNIFYNAPALLVISAPGDRRWCTEDCALAAQNAMLAARALGLGSCWIGFAQGWLNSQEGLKALALPEGTRVVAPLILGHPRSEPPPAARRKLQINWIGRVADDHPNGGEPFDALVHPQRYPHKEQLEGWKAWAPFRTYPGSCDPLPE